MQHALDYAESGHLATTSKVTDNTSWSGDNEQAIEQALKEMLPEERQAYMRGKMLAEGKPIDGLSPQDAEKARTTYEKIHTALEAAGDPWEVAKWEDQIAVKGGTLVTQLASHRGSVYDDSMGTVLSDIENMSEQDWKRYKSDEGYRKLVDTVLHDYLNDSEYERAKTALDAKMKSETYDGAKTAGRRDLTTILDDNQGTFNNDEHGIWDAIQNMTAAEQKRYRDDADFRNRVDGTVKSGLDEGAERDAAWGMLARVRKGLDPKADIVDKLNMHAADVDTDEAQVIRDLQEAFAADPSLRERLRNPKTDEDRALAQRFNIAIHRALDAGEYETYAQPLLETGHLSADIQMELNAGTFDDDEQGYYKDMVALSGSKDQASIDEKNRILSDKQYQDKVFTHLSADERKIALNALKQGEMRPEDLLYSYQVGAGTSEAEIKQVLAGLKPEEKERVKEEYARKYGSDLTEDLFSELGGQDLRDANRLLVRETSNDREAFNRTRDEVNESRDGFGRLWVDNVWDGTGYMTDDAVLNYQKRISAAHQQFQELSPEDQQQLRETVQKNLDSFVQSKGAAADMVVDVVIISAAVLGAKFTAGASLSAIAYTTLAGALFKIATKAAIMGADYDWASSQVLVDGLTGALDTATLFLGPAQLGQALKLGEKGAAAATNKLLTSGAEQLIKTEMKEQLAKEIANTVASAIAHGEEGVSDKAIMALAKKFAVAGQEETLAASIKQSLQEGMEQEARSALKRLVTETTLNASTGVIAGGSSGALRGTLEWDSAKTVEENLLMIAQQTGTGAVTGGVLAGALTIGFKAGGFALRKGYEGLQSLASGSEDAVKVNIRTEDGKAFVSPADNPHLEGIRRSDGTVVKFDGSQPIELQQGDLPVARLNEEGKLIDASGKLLKSDGTPVEVAAPPPSEVPPYKKGDTITFGDEPYQVAGFDNRNGDVIIYQKGRGDGNAVVAPRLNEGDLGTKYQPIRINGKEYFRDASGNVYAKVGEERPLLWPQNEYRAVPRDQIKFAAPPVEQPTPAKFGRGEVKVLGLETWKESGYVYETQGEPVGLKLQRGWYYPAKRPFISRGEIGSVKIDVTAKSLDDAAKIQQYLIPLLEKDPAFGPPKLVSWKTLDPAKGLQGGTSPLTDQQAKVFTLYIDNPADAIAIQKKLDMMIKDAGLGLDKPPATGNVFKVTGESNRVGMVRDVFTQSVDSQKWDPAINLDASVAKSLENEFGKGQRMTEAQLNTLIETVGLKKTDPPILFYDSEGKLSMRVDAGDGDNHGYSPYGVYVTEAGSGKQVGQLTDRPAVYRLYDRYGIDPAQEALRLQEGTVAANAPEVSVRQPTIRQANVNGQRYETGKVSVIGRGDDAQIKIAGDRGSEGVSSRHAAVFTDSEGNTYIADLGSKNGTYINGEKIPVSTDPNKPNWVRVKPGDKVTLGLRFELNLGGPD